MTKKLSTGDDVAQQSAEQEEKAQSQPLALIRIALQLGVRT
jgi:hypothetical protein